MCNACLLARGVEAIDDVLALTFGARPIDKALNPNIDSDFERISLQLSRRLSDVTFPDQAQALRAALNELDVDWPKLNLEEKSKITRRANKILKSPIPKIVPKVEEALLVNGKGLITDSKKDAITRYDLNIKPSFTHVDEKALEHLSKSPGNFVRNRFGKEADWLSERARQIVERGLRDGRGRDGIDRMLRREIGEQWKNRRSDYYKVVAAQFANSARTYANISSFHEAGIEQYTWESVLDEATTEECRFMHGKTFSVSGAMNTMGAAQSVMRGEDIKRVQPWLRSGVDELTGDKILYYNDPDNEGFGDEKYPQRVTVATIEQSALGEKDKVGKYDQFLNDRQLQERGMSLPPLHALCRSTVTPVVSPVPAATAAGPIPQPASMPAQPSVPGLGTHFKQYWASNSLDEDDRDAMLKLIKDNGMDDFMRRAPLGKLTFTKKTVSSDWGEVLRFDNQINESASGQYLAGKPGQNDLKIKIFRRAGTYNEDLKGKVPGARWSTSSTAKTERDAIQRTFMHELGHHVHMHGLNLENPKNSLASHRKIQEMIDFAHAKSYEESQGMRLNQKGGGISTYADSSSSEWFAEAFAMYHYEPRALHERDKWAFAAVERIRYEILQMKPPKGFDSSLHIKPWKF